MRINAESVHIEHEQISDAFEMLAHFAMAILAIIPMGLAVTSVILMEGYDELRDRKRARRWLKEHNAND